MYDAYICVPQTLTLMLVCMMHISMILDSCMYEARMVHASTYDAIFFGNGHTFNGRSSSSSRSEQGYYGVGIYDFLYIKKVTFPISGNFKPRG